MTGLQANAVAAPAFAASQTGASLPWNSAPESPLFPTGGVILMLILLAVACWAWWVGPQHRFRRGVRAWPWRAREGAGAAQNAPEILAATRLDAGTRLYVVRWQESELLLGVSDHSAPVVLDRHARRPIQGQP